MAPVGLHVEPINCATTTDTISALAVGAALQVSSGRVKITGEAMTRSESFPLNAIINGIADGDDADPLRLSFIIGVMLCLDENRTLEQQRAA
jgi:hypothetical protein